MFCDDFTNPALASSYSTVNGTWTRNTGSDVVTDATAWQRAFALLSPDVTDFDVTISGASLGDSGLGLIYGDLNSAGSFYAVLVHPSQFQGVFLKQVIAGQSDVDIASDSLPSELGNAPVTVHIVRAGTHVTVDLNGARVIDGDDGATNLHGQLGLLESTTNNTSGAGASFTLLRVDSESPYSTGGSSGSSGSTGSLPGPTTTLVALSANDTSTSPLFVDDYTNYSVAYGSQTSNTNGDFVPGSSVGSVDDGIISKESVTGLLTGGGTTTPIWVETQTWFCHLASNDDTSVSPAKLKPNARCGSHIDVGYNSDDPTHATRAIDDMLSRGFSGALMDWSGRDKGVSSYPTTTNPTTASARGSTEVCTNAIYAFMNEAEQRTGAFKIAVEEDEGITNCRNGWAGGCACWPAY